MAGSPKGGFPARRPGKLFGKKQMVMFGCIVLVLFVAPSLFGIGDTTDAHRIDPDDRGLVRTDFDGDRHRRRRRTGRFDGDDDGFDGGFRMHDAHDVNALHGDRHHSLGSSGSLRTRHERERDERHDRRVRERRRHGQPHGGLEHHIAERAAEFAIPRVEEYVNKRFVDPAMGAIERGDRIDPDDPAKGHKHAGVAGFFDSLAHPFGIGAEDASAETPHKHGNAFAAAADFGMPHHGKRSHRRADRDTYGEPPSPDAFADRFGDSNGDSLDERGDGEDSFDDVSSSGSFGNARDRSIGFHEDVDGDGSSSGGGSWLGSLFGGSSGHRAKREDDVRASARALGRRGGSSSRRGGSDGFERGSGDEDGGDEYGGGTTRRFDDPAPGKKSSSFGW